MDKEQIESLKNFIREAIAEALRDAGNDCSPFPLYTKAQVANFFHVSPHTVSDWHKKGLLRGARYQMMSGRCLRLMFSHRDLLAFMDEHMPRVSDLEANSVHDPRSKRTERIERMLRMTRLYHRRRAVNRTSE